MSLHKANDHVPCKEWFVCRMMIGGKPRRATAEQRRTLRTLIRGGANL